MNTSNRSGAAPRAAALHTSLATLLVAALPVTTALSPAVAAGMDICKRSAGNLHNACRNDLRVAYFTGRAVCLNLLDDDARRDCFDELREERRDGHGECREIRSERFALCSVIGGSAYDPPFGEDHAADFVDPLQIGGAVLPNPYLPLVPGATWTYEATFLDDEGESVTETITVTVTDETKFIEGITCITVNDVVEEDGELVEDTDDWFAQDVNGNVWYCGEIAENFEIFEGDDPEAPELVDIDGSWKSGREGARAGIQMPANPQVGQFIRQEVAWREAEDVIEITSITGSESTPGGSCAGDCVVTRDFTPLEPGVDEQKFHAPGIGLILELDADGNRVELVNYSIP